MKITGALIVGGVLLFGASVTHPFHFDDALIANDSNVTNPARWSHFFHPLYLRQLTFFSFYLNHLVGGLNPAGYHLVNVAIHIANAVLLFWLLRRFMDEWVAAGAAAIFLVHPVQTEAVLYVYQRSTLLACFFSLLALIALAKRRVAWAVVLFFLAFESKESALAVPLAVGLLTLRRNEWRENESPPREEGWSISTLRLDRSLRFARANQWLAFGALGIALGAFALFLLIDEKTVGLHVAVSPLRYLLTETRVIYTYLRLLVFPYPQSLEYDFHNTGGILAASGIILILLAGWFWRSISVLAFFLLLAPTSSIIPSADAAFEHRLYLPMLAFSMFAAYLISKLPGRTWIAMGLLFLLVVSSARREMVWSSDITLWEDTAKRAPGKARVWFNLGGAYLNINPDKAHDAFLRALDLQPHFPEAIYDLGVIEQGRKNWVSALSYYERALVQDPQYWQALNNMGNTLFGMGQASRSVEFFERTLRLNPDYWPAQYNIAIVHFISGRYSDAVPRLKTVLDWRPDFREARYLLAMSLTQSGKQNLADQEWRKLGEVNAAESRNTPTMILAPSRP
jgi:tetratricopeptide (TPR) repeat protein